MQKITPFLWFNENAEEAMNFYVSVFKNSKVLNVTSGPNGKAIGVTFELEGMQFRGLNGGPLYTFTEAISMMVDIETQEEVDELWGKLTEGGSEGRCGWLKDKYGLSWQIIPKILGQLINDPDPTKSKNVIDAMLQMNKIDIHKLQDAHDK